MSGPALTQILLCLVLRPYRSFASVDVDSKRRSRFVLDCNVEMRHYASPYTHHEREYDVTCEAPLHTSQSRVSPRCLLFRPHRYCDFVISFSIVSVHCGMTIMIHDKLLMCAQKSVVNRDIEQHNTHVSSTTARQYRLPHTRLN